MVGTVKYITDQIAESTIMCLTCYKKGSILMAAAKTWKRRREE